MMWRATSGRPYLLPVQQLEMVHTKEVVVVPLLLLASGLHFRLGQHLPRVLAHEGAGQDLHVAPQPPPTGPPLFSST